MPRSHNVHGWLAGLKTSETSFQKLPKLKEVLRFHHFTKASISETFNRIWAHQALVIV